MRLPGFLVRAEICVPKAHPHALWLLAWVERLIQGDSLDVIHAAPPWPVPGDALVCRQLIRELIDLRWVTPDWAGAGTRVAPRLIASWREGGRPGLARELFDAEVVHGEWWMDALGGTILSRQTAAQFDYDLKTRADIVLCGAAAPQQLLDECDPDLPDLLGKLGENELLWGARARAFLGTRLALGAPKDILFTLFGEDTRILPDELAELEPALERLAPQLFGEAKSAPRPAPALTANPVERLLSEAEALRDDAAVLGPLELVRSRLDDIEEMVTGAASKAIAAWIAAGSAVEVVAGPARRHFDWLAGVAAGLDALPESERSVLITSAFLNPEQLVAGDGLLAALAGAPRGTRVLLVYGHANDDLPPEQQADIARYVGRVRDTAPELAPRLTVVAGARRSHEKVIVTSAGDWLLGSWNAASSRPASSLFECSLAGRDASFAAGLADRIRHNVEGDIGARFVGRLASHLRSAAPRRGEATAREAMARLGAAVKDLKDVMIGGEGQPGRSWGSAVDALRRALHPLAAATRLEVVDETMTRDVLLANLRAARRDLVLASDRLGESALDAATLRDLQSPQRGPRTVRIVWGHEAGPHQAPGGEAASQLRRAQRTVREARQLLGPALFTSDNPMGNHAKLLVVDGRRGLVTSENVLSYGGEKGRGESRELGVAFTGIAAARGLLGALARRWPDELGLDASTVEWTRAGNRTLAAAAAAAPPVAPPSPPAIAPASRAQPKTAAANPSVDPIVARIMEGMVTIKAGAFMMGDERVPLERPRHRVVLSRAFLLASRPLTQAVWQAVMGRLPHLRDVERHPEFPIIQIHYRDIRTFLERLNGLPGSGGFDLPTEAQWEYACRAGSSTVYCFGDDPGGGSRPGQLERYAWTKRNAQARLQRVGQLEPNAWGLYDMHGLVYETMRDGFRTYSRAEAVDPIGPIDGGRVVARGGCWGRFPLDGGGRPEGEHFRCASRQVHEQSHRVSFRLMRHLEAKR